VSVSQKSLGFKRQKRRIKMLDFTSPFHQGVNLGNLTIKKYKKQGGKNEGISKYIHFCGLSLRAFWLWFF
jgi:hypothetical protein